ncbi:sensor histidine kinase [Frigoribacterium sp. 2-23]|uniref:sensor histidine kinase n=1 Tax=Frigoribacterium sp. 2-23 TaxID=3415006 RepID=UPI003C6EF7D7
MRASRGPLAADAEPPARDRSAPTRRQTRHDLWIAAALVGLGVATLALSAIVMADASAPRPGPLESILWLIVLCVPVAVRRRAPLTVLLVVSAAFLAAQFRGYPDTLTPALVEFLVIFTANAWARSRRTALIASSAVTGVLVACLLVWVVLEVTDGLDRVDPSSVNPENVAAIAYSLLFNGMFLVSAVAFGRAARVSASRLHALERVGVELRAAQELIADQAISEERTRIARELHDVVAHHVAVIGIQAGAARRTLDRPEIARGALAAVEGTARTAIDELDRLLSVLRSRDETAPASVTGLADLPELIATTEALGLSVRFQVHGTVRDIPESIGVTVYRITQEALTNTLKHGRASVADVHLRYRERSLELEVLDDGRAPLTARPSEGGPGAEATAGSATATARNAPHDTRPGLGQRGMRERVDLHAGELVVGPRRRGGYRVRAQLPAPPCDTVWPTPEHEMRETP